MTFAAGKRIITIGHPYTRAKMQAAYLVSGDIGRVHVWYEAGVWRVESMETHTQYIRQHIADVESTIDGLCGAKNNAKITAIMQLMDDPA